MTRFLAMLFLPEKYSALLFLLYFVTAYFVRAPDFYFHQSTRLVCSTVIQFAARQVHV